MPSLFPIEKNSIAVYRKVFHLILPHHPRVELCYRFTIIFFYGGIFLLRDWTPHSEYQEKLRVKMLLHHQTQRSRLADLDKSVSKLYLLNLDSLLPVIKPLYPDFGRPARNQQGTIRSLILMLDQQVYSITKWAKR
jgi:hypothetical protein